LTVACCLLTITAALAFANEPGGIKTQRKQGEAVYALPVPDSLLLPPAPDSPVPLVAELRPIIRPSTNWGQGIDISHHQGHINWDRVPRDKNIQFIYVKATEGAGHVDDLYLRNFYGAKRGNIPVGSYHFFSPSVSALTQLENFLTNADPRQQDLIPVIDVEKRGKGPLSQFQGRLKAFLEGVERVYGVKPIIYTGVNFYAEYLEGSFTGYRFMIARYADEFPGLCEDVPILLWQYTSKGRAEGIKGDVDRSVFLDRYNVADIMLKKN